MPGQKTVPTAASVNGFIAKVEPERRREDAKVVLDLMKRVTKLKPKMWGPSIIGFGQRRYRYESGHEGDTFLVGFSPRKANLVLYLMPGMKGQEADLAKLGKHKTSVACLYVNKLDDVDLKVLERMVRRAFDWSAARSQ